MKIISVTGGIGSGKSVICEVLITLGFQVYNCDERARMLIYTSNTIQRTISNQISPAAVTENGIARKVLADIVFNNSSLLAKLNKITHSAIREDIVKWKTLLEQKEKVVFIETAILYESGLDKLVDEVWQVIAPIEIKLQRLIKYRHFSEQEGKKRMKVQNNDIIQGAHVIINDNIQPVLPQIEKLLSELK